MTQLKSSIWVQSYILCLQRLSIPAYVVARGDPDRGAIMIKLNLLNGTAKLFQRSFDLLQERSCWLLTEEGGEALIDQRLRRETKRDSDLWIVEIEDREGRNLLDEEALLE